MENKQKPDGYVAWHPKYGYDRSRQDGTITIYKGKKGARWSKCPYKGRCCFNGGGYKVVPVKLVFLDEGEK